MQDEWTDRCCGWWGIVSNEVAGDEASRVFYLMLFFLWRRDSSCVARWADRISTACHVRIGVQAFLTCVVSPPETLPRRFRSSTNGVGGWMAADACGLRGLTGGGGWLQVQIGWVQGSRGAG